MNKVMMTAYDLAQRFVGVKEASGTASNPQVLAMLRLDNSWPGGDDVAWCFTGDVELLTEDGFVRFDKLQEGRRVAQVDPFLGVEFIDPIRYIRRNHTGDLITLNSRDFGLTCDSDHRFLGVWNRANYKAGPLDLRPIRELTSVLFVPPVATIVERDNPSWSDRDLSLLAAFLSDGCIHRGRISVQVSKERKLNALIALEPIHVYNAAKAYGVSTMPLTTFEYAQPESFFGIFDDYKEPTWSLLRSLSKRQLSHFIDSYLIFDGSERNGSMRLYSSRPKLRDWLQAAVTLSGRHSSYRQSSISPISGQPCWEVVFAPEKRTRTIRADQVTRHEGRADLYCVEVPSGVIVIRDPKGTVIPVGNCSAFVNYVTWLLRLPRSKSLSARSWLLVGTPVSLHEAEAGGNDVVILRRGVGAQPGPEVLDAPGHVGFFAGIDGDKVLVLGGNQADMVSITRYPLINVLGVRRLL